MAARKKVTINLVPNHQIVSAALFEWAQNQKWSLKRISGELKMSPSTIQASLNGTVILKVDRLREICAVIGVKEQAVYDMRDDMLAQIVKELGKSRLVTRFPTSIGPTERIVRTMDIGRRRTGQGWDEIYAPNLIGPDGLMRLRNVVGWTRKVAAKTFGVSEPTYYSWERVGLPLHRDPVVRKIFAAQIADESIPEPV